MVILIFGVGQFGKEWKKEIQKGNDKISSTVFSEVLRMSEMSLNCQIGPFLEFSGRSVWLPRGMAMVPFGHRASLGIFLGGTF